MKGKCCPFLIGGVFECDIVHHRSVAVLCMQYKIRCNPVHTFHGSLPTPYVPVRDTRGALVAHRYTHSINCSRTSQDRWSFIPPHCPSGTILLTLDPMMWDWRVSRAGSMLFHWRTCSIPTIVFYNFTLSHISVY